MPATALLGEQFKIRGRKFFVACVSKSKSFRSLDYEIFYGF